MKGQTFNEKKLLKQFYNRDFGDSYIQKRFRNCNCFNLDQVILERKLRRLSFRKQPKILDIGCGVGRFIPVVLNFRKDASYIGLDISKAMLEYVRKKFINLIHEKKIEFIRGDVENLPFSDGLFDLVFSFQLITHFSSIDKALNEMIRVCRHGGYILFDLHNLLRPDLPFIILYKLFHFKVFYFRNSAPQYFYLPTTIHKIIHKTSVNIQGITGRRFFPHFIYHFILKFFGFDRLVFIEEKLGKSFLKYFSTTVWIVLRKK